MIAVDRESGVEEKRGASKWRPARWHSRVDMAARSRASL